MLKIRAALCFCLWLGCGLTPIETTSRSPIPSVTILKEGWSGGFLQNHQKGKAEPFDGASVSEMASQCVTLNTDLGDIQLSMLPESAPETVRNFLNLVAIKAFDTTTFSRVVPDFVTQGGNLSTRLNLTPELARRSRRTIPDEPNSIKHVRSIVSMARTDEPNSATTNFFILVGEAQQLDGKFAAFGRVNKGMEVVDKINHSPVKEEKPLEPVRINRAFVTQCGPETTQH